MIIFSIYFHNCISINRYLLKERTDDSILLALVVRVIDALVNYGMFTRLKDSSWVFFPVYVMVYCCRQLGISRMVTPFSSLESRVYFYNWASMQLHCSISCSRKKEVCLSEFVDSDSSMCIVIEVLNFVSIRPRWALVDKANLHSTWRCSQSSYHRYRTNAEVSPSGLMTDLMNDLLDLSLHNYEIVRS